MEEEKLETGEGAAAKVRTWIQENLRVITSVFIVAVIAIGIYSYSDRSVPTDETGISGEISSSETEKIAEEEEETEAEEIATEETSDSEETVTVAEEEPKELSRETEGSFIETAERGDGLTHLARRAASNYLEKNPDSSVTVEHRIYIEDYLRKKIAHEGGVHVGTSVEFSKDLIEEAIGASKNLSESQLENLKKYSARVSEFRS